MSSRADVGRLLSEHSGTAVPYVQVGVMRDDSSDWASGHAPMRRIRRPVPGEWGDLIEASMMGEWYEFDLEP